MSIENTKGTNWAILSNQQLIGVLAAIERTLKCTLCLGYIRDPAATCINGHGLCTGCSTKLPECPQCHTSISTVKPTMLNAIISLIPHPCRHSFNGCDKTILSPSEDHHERYCGYRESACWLDDCYWEGPLNGLLTHLQCDHPTSLYYAHNEDVEWPVLQEDQLHSIAFYVFDSIIWASARLDSRGLKISFEVWPEKAIPRLLAVISLKRGIISITETISVEDVANVSEGCATWKKEISLTRKVSNLLMFNGRLRHRIKFMEDVL